ncbi:MAG: RNA 2',3'-cyclic phosphodiesterase [Candidatus Magasanikbacteria bacterium]|nr:RNA 2',3'-cyclic phosphodiesterase [Candidatus Magasanikbacteria bacterium]
MQRKRIFIAFPLSKNAVKEAIKIQNKLKKLNKESHLKWTSPENLHLTFIFLGNLNKEDIERVFKLLKSIIHSKQAPQFWFDNLNAFPNKNNPAMIHIKIKEENNYAKKILKEFKRNLILNQSLDANKQWKPHVTIARNKKKGHIDGLYSIDVEKIVWQPETINIYESILNSDGPRYKIINQVHFNNNL